MKLNCPACKNKLAPIHTKAGMFLGCAECDGHFIFLEQIQDQPLFEKLKSHLKSKDSIISAGTSDRNCSNCQRPMRLDSHQDIHASFAVDVCDSCKSYWFDAKEWGHVIQSNNEQKNAKLRIGPFGVFPLNHATHTPLQKIAIALGFPVEENDDAYTFHWGLLITTLLCLSIHIFVPEDLRLTYLAFDRQNILPWTFLTSAFVHSSWMHLLGNMYFLQIFGDDIEEYFGTLGFIILFVLGHILGVVSELIFNPYFRYLVGASAGLYAIMFFYGIRLKQRRIMFSFGPIILLLTRSYFSVPITFAIITYFVFDAVGVLMEHSGMSSVAHLAHVAGGLSGLFLAVIWPRPKSKNLITKN